MADRDSRRGKKKTEQFWGIFCVDPCSLLLQHLSTHLHFITTITNAFQRPTRPIQGSVPLMSGRTGTLAYIISHNLPLNFELLLKSNSQMASEALWMLLTNAPRIKHCLGMGGRLDSSPILVWEVPSYYLNLLWNNPVAYSTVRARRQNVVPRNRFWNAEHHITVVFWGWHGIGTWVKSTWGVIINLIPSWSSGKTIGFRFSTSCPRPRSSSWWNNN